MYGHSNYNANEIPCGFSTEFPGHFPFPELNSPSSFSLISAPPPLAIPANDYDSLSPLKSELGYSSSGCSSYSSPTSLTSYGGNNYYGSSPSYGAASSSNLMQRSISSQSLQKNIEGFTPVVSSPTGYGYIESETSPVRKVFSTGDLQGMNLIMHQSHRSDSPLANELSIIEGMSKACRYSPEEKKERIERYRSKRNQRNFNKKIKYECRKTLADSRPRIRGRFARNDEIEKASQNQWGDHAAGMEEDEEDEENLISILDALSANYLIP